MSSIVGRRAALLASLSVVALSSGCQQLYELEELNRPGPGTQAEAGSTHVFGVAYPWRSFADALQPTFAMTPELALQQSLPTTASFTSRVVEALRAQLAVGLPRSTETETQTRATDAAGVRTVTDSRARSEEPGVAPALPAPLGTVPGAGTLSTLQTALAQEPFLRYSTANDLFQEVQILNRALRELPIGTDVVPYLVRLKVSPLTYRRNLNYDVYSDIVFFDARPERNNRPDDERQSATEQGTRPTPEAVECPWKKQPQAAPTARVRQLPFVVPLLVTDDLEVASDAVTAQSIVELAAALSGTPGNAGVGGQVQALRDSLNAALANSSNALRTVVRLNDNAIRVRLGASYAAGPFGTKSYEQRTRTHNVSLLLLVPKAQIEGLGENRDARIEVVTRTSLRGVKEGALLPTLDPDESFAGLQRIADGLKLPRRVAQGRLCKGEPCSKLITDKDVIAEDRQNAYRLASALRGFALYGEIDEFNTMLAKCTGGFDSDRDVRDLWAELASFTGSYNVAASTVRLPKPPARCLPPAEQLVLLRDDNKATTAQVAGVAGYEVSEISARLTAAEVGSSSPKPELPAGTVSLTGGLLTLTFPSLGALGIVTAPSAGKVKQVDGALRIYGPKVDARCGDGEGGIRAAGYTKQKMPAEYGSLRYAVLEPAKEAKWTDQEPPVRAVPATHVVADQGVGQVGVGVSFEPGNPAGAVFLSAEGAEIAAASVGQLDPLGRVRLDKPAFVLLTLRNLAPGQKVTIRGLLRPAADGAKPDARELGAVTVVTTPKPSTEGRGSA